MKTLKTNDLEKKYLVDQCKTISISDYTKSTKDEVRKFITTAQISVDDIDVSLTTSKTYFNGLRYWFMCPLCNGRVGKLYKHPITLKIGCRMCLNLEYRCRKYKGMIEGNNEVNR